MNLRESIIEFNQTVKKFDREKYKLPFRVLFQKRRFHAFCIGTPKSGTHSICSMLEQYRSKHEPLEVFMIHLISKWISGEITQPQLDQLLLSKHRYLWLEMEASHYNGIFVSDLASLLPEAKFILTIRDCLSWTDSWFNHQLARPIQSKNSVWNLGRNNYYSMNFEYTKHDKFLKELNLFPLRAYLTFWKNHNQRIIDTITEDRRLMVKTEEISKSGDEIAKFLGIDAKTIAIEKSHSFKKKGEFNILQKIDPIYLYETSTDICGEINDRYFPEATITKFIENITIKK